MSETAMGEGASGEPTDATDDEGSAFDYRVLVLALGTFTVITGNYVFIGVLGGLAADLGVSVGLAGQLVTVFAVTNAVGAPLLVSLTGRFERRRLLLSAMAVYAAASAAAFVLPTFGLLAASRVVAAAAAAVFTPVAAAVATTFVPPEKAGAALAIVNSGLTFAFVAGIPLGTVVGGGFGWRATFLFAAALVVVVALVVVAALPRVGRLETTDLRSLAVVRRPGVALDVSLTALGFTAIFVAQAYIGPVLSGMTGFDEPGIGALQVVLGVAGLAGVVAGGVGADRVDSGLLLGGIFLALTLGLVPFSLFAGAGGGTVAVASAVAAMVFGGAGLFALVPVQQSRLVRRAPERRDVVLALNAAALFLGQALGAGIGGVVTTVGSLADLGYAGAVVAAVGVAVVVLTRRFDAAAATAADLADD
jgi:DHA1 family purine base/nucleoside efflux pump-like MFS transporter